MPLYEYSCTSCGKRFEVLMREGVTPAQLKRAEKVAAAVAAIKDGSRVSVCGLVLVRQRPGTASGVVFITLEDETGFVNVVLWPTVWTTYRVLVKTSPILGVTGRLESQQGVAHLIAEQVWVPQLKQPVPTGGSAPRSLHSVPAVAQSWRAMS